MRRQKTFYTIEAGTKKPYKAKLFKSGFKKIFKKRVCYYRHYLKKQNKMRESLKTDSLEQNIEVLAGRSMLHLEETL